MKTKGRSFALLSGEDSALPRAELRALVETQDPNATIDALHPRLHVISGDVDPTLLSKRGAYVRLAGEIIEILPGSESEIRNGLRLDGLDSFSRLGVWSHRLAEGADTWLRPLVGEIIRRDCGAKIDLDDPETTVVGITLGEEVLFGWIAGSPARKGWSQRKPRARRFFHPSTLYPKLARGLVNLCRVRPGQTLLDPFCGTGSILIEAGLVGARVLGADLSKRMIRGTKANLRQYGVSDSDLIRADSLSSPITGIDAVATDIPYGRCASTHGADEQRILDRFIPFLADALPRDAHASLMHSHRTKVPDSDGLKKLEEIEIYVHRELTRVISILGKV